MAQGKLSYQHTTEAAEPAPKKRRTVTRVERPVTVAKHFATADASLVTEISKIFEGKELYIVNGPAQCDKMKLEQTVLENGGSIVQSPGVATFCVIAHNVNIRVKNIMKQEKFDVVHSSWLMECLESKQCVPWLPSHMLHTSQKTKDKFALEYDINGDSYTKDTNVECLKETFRRITEKQTMVKLTEKEIAEVESRYFADSPLGLFRQYRFYMDQFSEIGDPATKIPHSSLALHALEVRFYGGVISDQLDEHVTHVIVNSRDRARLAAIKQLTHDRLRKPHVITEFWLTDCIEHGAIVNERAYGPW